MNLVAEAKQDKGQSLVRGLWGKALPEQKAF